jgi:hypothetical protein
MGANDANLIAKALRCRKYARFLSGADPCTGDASLADHVHAHVPQSPHARIRGVGLAKATSAPRSRSPRNRMRP